MELLEAMRRSNSEHEIQFLLSAYVETLPFYGLAHILPNGLTALPVRGTDDVRDRFEALIEADLRGSAAVSSASTHAVVREATEVFGMALSRLSALHTNACRADAQYLAPAA